MLALMCECAVVLIPHHTATAQLDPRLIPNTTIPFTLTLTLTLCSMLDAVLKSKELKNSRFVLLMLIPSLILILMCLSNTNRVLDV